MRSSVNRPSDYNIAHNVIDAIAISTGACATFIDNAGGWVRTYETLIFEFDKATHQRGGVLKSYYHKSESQAIDFHFTYSKKVTRRVVDAYIKAEEKLLIEVLSSVIGREPTNEDFKKCEKLHPLNTLGGAERSWCWLKYDEIVLGKVVFLSESCRIDFIPLNEKN